jgi:MYXO-CTERM domain-containing protein
MKKLALASVALAGVAAFGAGDAFAAGFVGYTNTLNPGGFSSTDYTLWGSVGATGSAGGGSTATFDAVSHKNHIGVTAQYMATPTPSFAPTLKVFQQSPLMMLQAEVVDGGDFIHGGFPDGMTVLGNNVTSGNSGSIQLFFAQGLSAIGLDLSPFTADWGANLIAYNSAGITLGTVSLTGANLCRGTGYAGCTSPQFIGATDPTTPIASVDIFINGNGSIAIGTLLETASPIPEPASLSVLGVGLLGLAALGRRRRSRDPDDGSRWSPFGRWRVAKHPPDPTTS